jgi:hypothetical protein
MLVDHSQMQLGKREPKVSSRDLLTANYFLPNLPPPPEEIDFTRGRTNFGMMLNDKLGCCTIAAPGHAIQIWSGKTVSDTIIQTAYEQWNGYNPADPSTDQGGIEVDVQNNWIKYGLGGHFLKAYTTTDKNNLTHVKKAVEIFAVINIGLALPVSAQYEQVWKSNEGGLWGLHDVIIPKYNKIGPVCVTWGALKQMTWDFLVQCCDEVHPLLSEDFDSNQIDLTQLNADLAVVQG